jgi:hypothetical protein
MARARAGAAGWEVVRLGWGGRGAASREPPRRAISEVLFNPLRRRVQQAVDRQFNRARYDADQAVAAFAARLKDAVELDAVRDDLTGVVQHAREPAHVSVWVSRPG